MEYYVKATKQLWFFVTIDSLISIESLNLSSTIESMPTNNHCVCPLTLSTQSVILLNIFVFLFLKYLCMCLLSSNVLTTPFNSIVWLYFPLKKMASAVNASVSLPSSTSSSLTTRASTVYSERVSFSKVQWSNP